MLARIILWLCHLQYKKFGKTVLFIEATNDKCPQYLFYTENEAGSYRIRSRCHGSNNI